MPPPPPPLYRPTPHPISSFGLNLLCQATCLLRTDWPGCRGVLTLQVLLYSDCDFENAILNGGPKRLTHSVMVGLFIIFTIFRRAVLSRPWTALKTVSVQPPNSTHSPESML